MIPTILQSEPSTPAFPIAGSMRQSASRHKTKKNIAIAGVILAGFPDEACYDDAVRKAELVRDASAVSSEKALEVAQALQLAKLELSRKGFATFIRELVGWAGTLSKKYIKLAQTFAGIEIERLRGVEVGTLFKLSGRKYKAVVEYIKQSTEKITQQLVEDLIKELLPKKPRRQVKKVVPGNIALQEHVQGNDRYFTLHANGLNLGRENALWLQEQLENRTFDQLLTFLRHQEAEFQQTEEAQAAVVVQKPESENWVLQEELRQHEEIEQAPVAQKEEEIVDLKAQIEKASEAEFIAKEHLSESEVAADMARRNSLRNKIEIERLVNTALGVTEPQALHDKLPDQTMAESKDSVSPPENLPKMDSYTLKANGNLVNLCSAPSRPRPADVLVQVFRDADSWEPIREALVTYADQKLEAWSVIAEAEQQKVIDLMPEAVRQLFKGYRMEIHLLKLAR